MAGGGLKSGFVYGATDEVGMRSVENVTEVFDLHATILQLLGLDHKKLTYRFGGRDVQPHRRSWARCQRHSRLKFPF